MVRDGALLGVMVMIRTEVKAFTDREIALVETFADQAVIAIENTRLFQELEERNKDLSESLAQQTATGDVLRVIASSPTDLQVLLDTLAENAARLCDSSDALIRQVDGDSLRLIANYGPIPPRTGSVPIDGTLLGLAFRDGRTHTSLISPNKTTSPSSPAQQWGVVARWWCRYAEEWASALS